MDQNNIDDVPTGSELAGQVAAQHGMIRSAFQKAKRGSDDEERAATT